MSRQRLLQFRHRWLAASFLGIVALVLVASSSPEPAQGHKAAGAGNAAPCTVVIGTPDLSCMAPPNTFPTGGLNGLANGHAWDAWAWSSFAALNWPALKVPPSKIYPSGYVRGIPDKNKSFATARSQDVAVWETFKEKRELFNSEAAPGRWQQLTFDPKYAPDFSGGQIQACRARTSRCSNKSKQRLM